MAVIYARQSLDRTGEGAAVDRQVESCRELAERRGWAVSDVLTDNDVSASTGAPRPAYQRLLEMMRSGSVDVVVVYHVDRLTRRLVDLEDVISICERTGTRLATVTGDLDLSTDTGRMLARILASVARGEVERKGARQRAANRQRATQGKARWVRRPFGYDMRDGEVVVVEAEAEAIRGAAAAVLAGQSIGAIAKEWNAAGLPTTTGGEWRTSPLRRVISNPRLAGRSIYKGTDLGPGQWPPILDADTLALVEQKLSDPRRRTAFNTTAKHLLSGIAMCGVCGVDMYGTPAGTGQRRWMAYRCPKYHVTRRMDLVDEVVSGVILARLARPDAARLLAPDVDLDALQAEAHDIRERRTALAAMLAEGILPASAVRVQAARLSSQLEEVERAVSAATGDNPAFTVATSADVEQAWETLTLAARRAVIRTLARVTIEQAGRGARFAPEQVRIEWKGKDS